MTSATASTSRGGTRGCIAWNGRRAGFGVHVRSFFGGRSSYPCLVGVWVGLGSRRGGGQGGRGRWPMGRLLPADIFDSISRIRRQFASVFVLV